MIRPTLCAAVLLAAVTAGCSPRRQDAAPAAAPPAAAQGCAALDQPLTPDSRAAAVSAVAATLPVDAGAVTVQRVMASGPWRAIWAEPANLERGVFFFRDGAHVETWGGVAQPDEREQVASWARALPGAPPQPLADCFAAAITEKGAP